jgi:hypothetical protein
MNYSLDGCREKDVIVKVVVLLSDVNFATHDEEIFFKPALK